MKTLFKERRTWCAVRLLMLVALMGGVFTACSDDEDSSGVVYYSAGFGSFSSSDISFIAKMGQVEDLYYSAMQVSDSPFALNGSVEECDNRVKEACKRAEAGVAAIGLTDTYFEYTVDNITTGQTVYSYTFDNR